MLGLFKGYSGSDVWSELNSIEQLKDLYQQSDTSPVVLFKHSTRCSISSMAKSRIENYFPNRDVYIVEMLNSWAAGGGVHCHTNDQPAQSILDYINL